MSLNPQDIKGSFVVTATIQAKAGKVDELAQWLANLKARADSDLEPGTLTFRISRFGESFSVFEEYTDLEALGKHMNENPLYQEFREIQHEFMESVTPLFWPAKSLPEPTIRPQD